MKKLFFALAAGLVIGAAGFTGFKVYDNYQMSKCNDLLIQNLDALSQDDREGGDNWRDGRSIEGIHIYKGVSISSGNIVVSRSDISASFPGLTWNFEWIYCCELTHPRNSCNAIGENSLCGNILP